MSLWGYNPSPNILLGDMERILELSNDENTEKTNAISSSTESHSNSSEDISKILDKFRLAAPKNSELDNSVEKNQLDKIEELARQKRDLEDQVNSLLSQIKSLSDQKDELSKLYSAISVEVNELTSQKAIIQKSIEELAVQKEYSEQQISAERQIKQTEQEELDRLRSQKQTEQEELIKLRKCIDNENTRLEILRKQIKSNSEIHRDEQLTKKDKLSEDDKLKNRIKETNFESEIDRYNAMDTNSVYKLVRGYIDEIDMTKRLINRDILDNKFGKQNINRLIVKSYLINIPGKGVTFGNV